MSELRNVELLGPIFATRNIGSRSGMCALQKGLRKRIAQGLDWLEIRQLPATPGKIAWFWRLQDRKEAICWDRAGQPWVDGPDMLTVNCEPPRRDIEECQVLDAQNRRAIFCHSQWYADHLSRSLEASNTCPIIQWPYPIAPWPGDPKPDRYDVLIYAGDGHDQGLVEPISQLFPRTKVLYNGEHSSQELIAVARVSRACVFLPDKVDGPIALQVILLAGCPTVGLKTGATYIRENETGCHIAQFPGGRASSPHKTNDGDVCMLMHAIGRAHALDRQKVHAVAANDFDTEIIVDSVIAALNRSRMNVSNQNESGYRGVPTNDRSAQSHWTEVRIDGTTLLFDIRGMEDDYVCHFIANGRLYESANLSYIRKLEVPSGGVYVDVGAFVGTHSIYFAKCCEARLVLAFEPNPAAFEALCRNVAANNAPIVSHCFGLGSGDTGEANLACLDSSNLGGARVSQIGRNIKVVSLDACFQEPTLDVLKIDVEGYELEVLRGAVETIWRCRPRHIFVESWTEITCRSRGLRYLLPDVTALLDSLGYAHKRVLDEDLHHYEAVKF